ncbi:MAG: HAD family phosphatase [Actinomycetia bacterium]|nr:HAD family phosphatase [Actinomycetes bacterium]
MDEIALVALDLDGTLLDSSGEVPGRVRDAIEAAVEVGIEVVAATGRPPSVAARVLEQAGFPRWAICSNGSVTIDLQRNRIHRADWVEEALLRQELPIIRERYPRLRFAVELEASVLHEKGFHLLVHESPESGEVDDVLAVAWPERVHKVLVFDGTDGVVGSKAAVAIKTMVEGLLDNQLEVTVSGLPFAELAPMGVSKASALEALGADLGLGADHVLAMGDNENDHSMLRWARIGVAMANATPGTVEVADRIAASNDDDGVALILEELIMVRP